MNDVTELDGSMSFGEGLDGSMSFNDSMSGSMDMGGITVLDGTYDYNELENRPSIEGHELIGDSTLPQIGVWDITPQQIDNIIYG